MFIYLGGFPLWEKYIVVPNFSFFITEVFIGFRILKLKPSVLSTLQASEINVVYVCKGVWLISSKGVDNSFIWWNWRKW